MAEKKKKNTQVKKELSAREKQKINGKNMLYLYIGIYILVVFFSMHMGHAAYGDGNTGFGDATPIAKGFVALFVQATANIQSEPFSILPFSLMHLKYLAIFTIVFGVLAAIRYLDYQRYKETMPEESKGTAKWNEDFEGFAKKYSTEPEVALKPSKKGKNTEEETLPSTNVDMNLMFTSKNRLSFDNKKTKRNTNTVIMGGSGTGKSFSYIEPNIAQSNSSFVITDPSGEIFQNMNKFLKDEGYEVKVLNLQYYDRGNHYNPFDYIRRKEDGSCDQTSVMAMVASFLDNAGSGNAKEDEFWRASAEALFCAAAFYLIECRPYKEWTMRNVSKLIRQAKKNEADASSDTAFDTLMKSAYDKNPNSMAYSFYQTFKLASSKTAESILVSTDVKLSKFSIPEINKLTTTDLDDTDNNINLNTIGDKKTALFIITQTGGGPCDFLCSMLYNQLFDILYDRAGVYCPTKFHIYSKNGYPIDTMISSKEEAEALIEERKQCKVQEVNENNVMSYVIIKPDGKKLMDKKPSLNKDIDACYKPRVLKFDTLLKAQNFLDEYKSSYIKQTGMSLPWSVTCLLDEFNNIGEIPKFDQILATCRKYNINISIVLQNLAQLKGRYKDVWNTILGNCDNFLFLGSSEQETCKYVSEILGKGTIVEKSASRASDIKGKANYSFSHAARELLTPDELIRMDNSECIYVMRGEYPFKVPKIDFSKHINFMRTGCGDKSKETSDAEMKQIFAEKPKRRKRKNNQVRTEAEKHAVETKQAQNTPVILETKEDVQKQLGNVYTEEQAKATVAQPRDVKFDNKLKEAMSSSADDIKIEENGAESWMF